MAYIVTNITDVSSNPREIRIGDIPNRPTVTIAPGENIDLELLSTRNDILESVQLKVHILEHRATADTLGTQPSIRFFVDSNLSIGDVTIAMGAIEAIIDGYSHTVTGTHTGSKYQLDVSDATAQGSLASIDSKLNSLGQKVSSSSVPVVIASDQTPVFVALQDAYGVGLTSTDGYLNVSVANATFDVSTDLHDGYGKPISSTGSSLNTNVTNTVTIAGIVAVSNLPTTVDTNYGTVGSSTLRTTAQVGNATGAADFNGGATGAQTLRTTSNVSDGYGNKISSTNGYLDVNIHGESFDLSTDLHDGYGNAITSGANSAGTKRPLDVWSTKGTPQHFNGTVGTSPTTLTPAATTVSLLLLNPTTNANGVVLSASFDGGANFFDITRGSTLSLEAEMSSFQVKGSSAGTAYQIIVTHR